MARIFMFTAAVLAALICCAQAGEGRTVKITIENKTPDFVVEPSIAVFGGDPAAFTKLSDSKFEYQFNVDPSQWFNTVDIKLAWKQAFAEDDGSKADFTQNSQTTNSP